MSPGATLSRLGTTVLRKLREEFASKAMDLPITEAKLVARGFGALAGPIHSALAGHSRNACLLVLDALLAERASQRPPPELVWTGPEAPRATARDTAVLLRSLFERARESVILAGYSFTHAHEVLKPLADNMKQRDLEVLFFVHVDQPKPGTDPEAWVESQLRTFLETNWPFSDPKPTLYYDNRALRPGPPWSSLHAKCVVIDHKTAFLSSANFTHQGQEKNIEAGILLEDPDFAAHLAAQWRSLITARLVDAFAG